MMTTPSPWDEACDRVLSRFDARTGREVDLAAGVTFFVEKLESLGVCIRYADGGDPHGFRVAFSAPIQTARRVSSAGAFIVEVGKGVDEFSIRLDEKGRWNEEARRTALRAAARVWSRSIPKRKKPPVLPNDIARAHHESAQAVVFLSKGCRLESLTIGVEHGRKGYSLADGDFSKLSFRDQAICFYAGYAMSSRYRAVGDLARHIDTDFTRGCTLEKKMPESERALPRPFREAKEILEAKWPTVEAIAAKLLERRALTGAEVDTIIREIETGRG